MTQKIQLPNGDTLEFPDDMADDAIAKAITSNYPEFAPKAAAPRTLAGMPVQDADAPAPAPDERPRVLAGMPVKDAPLLDAAQPAADAYQPGAEQNQFAATRMSRPDYEREFRALNPRAQQGAVDAALATYDKQKATQLKAADAKRQAGPMKGVPGSDDFFNDRLNARLQAKNQGIVQVQPGHEQQDFSSTSTKHGANPDDESAISAAGSFLGRSASAGLYDLAGAGAKLLDAINPFTTSDADAAILFKNDPAKLKQMQDESIALGLGRFARAMQADSSDQMDKVSARGKRDYSSLEYATTDASKSAFLSPVKVAGDAIRSLPSSMAMAASAYVTRGASLRAEQAALTAGLSASAARAAGVQAAMRTMGNVGAASEGAIGYAQQAISSADDASKIPMSTLQKAPQFQALLKQGYTPETARAQIIADIGEHAGQIGGMVDAVTNKYGGEFLGKIISEGGPFLRRVLSGAANESATEFVQSAGEQMGQNFATQKNADPDKRLMEGVPEAALAGFGVGGFMGGATAGVAGHHPHVDEHAIARFIDENRESAGAANTARDAALGNWNTNGLSPSSRPGATGRIEPTWGQATGDTIAGESVANMQTDYLERILKNSSGPAADKARNELRRRAAAPAAPSAPAPSVADIGAATSVDDAIAAATAVTAAPASMPNLPTIPNTSPHATGAEIDALEEAAGMVADHAPEEAQAAHEQLMSDMQARALERQPAAPAEPAADLPPGGKTVDDAADWHPFPPESRTLGVPRAQMPQIRAEHRGAMTQFLNARGISHEDIEVAPDTLKPTQREFSVSKVQKALEYQGGNRAILVSSDGYVLDGHHQWMAAMEKGEPIRAIRLNAPIKQLVKTVHQFPSATVDTSSAAAAPAAAAPADTARPLSAYEQGQERNRRQEEVVRQAAERQAQHRAGQAPQEPGSSVPPAAERAPAAPMPAPKPTAGQRMRERISRENPFLGFLATHGLHISERSDTGGQKGRAGGVIVPGFGGSLYRKNGARLDELAQLAHEAGFLTDDDINSPTDTGGTRKLADMIQSAVHSKEVIRPAGLLDAVAPSSDDRLHEEAQRLGIDTTGKTADALYDEVRAAHVGEEEKQAASGATSHDEQDAIDHYADQFDLADVRDADIPFDLNDERMLDITNLNDEETDAKFGIQKAAGPREGGSKAGASTAGPASEGIARAGAPGEGEGQDLLTSYTAGDVVAREDATTAREKAVKAEREKLEAQRKAEQDAKEARARADATVDDFQLGQDAHAQLSGQRSMFDEPAPATKSQAKQGPAEEAFADLLATKAMADYREMEAAGKASFKAGFVDGFEGKPFPVAAVKDGAMDEGYRFGKRHARELETERRIKQAEQDDDRPMGHYGDADKPLRFASGMSAPKDYAEMFAAGGNVGITITELSDKSIPAIAKAMASAPQAAHLFVDSGAFSVFRTNLKAKDSGQMGFDDVLSEFAPGGKALDFDKILDRYHALESAISKADDRGYTNDRAFFVMPDVVGNQAESIALAKKYADYINGHGLRAIVPLQSGELSLTQAYEAVMRNLGKDPTDLSPVLGIPSNAAAASDEEFLALMKKYGDNIMGVHILGAAQEATLQPRLDVLKQAGYDGNVSADANLLRSFMYGDTDRATAMRKAAAMVGSKQAALEQEVEKAKKGGKHEKATAPEHVTEGVDDRELGEIVGEFNRAMSEMMQDGHPVTNVFAAPAKRDVVRLEDKTKVYNKEHGWMTVAEAKQRIAEWKKNALEQGTDNKARNANSQRVVLSLFDLTGKWSQPWEEAGYQVYRFDIQADPVVGDVNNFSTDFFGDWFGDFDGMDVYAILAATPCTDFASSGSRHFAAKDEDGRTVASVKLVHQTLRTIEYFKPAVWALENPVGRIEKLGGLPPWRLSFNPNHLGDPYTKRTLLWGRFNGDLPIAPVEPTEGSKMHKLYGGKSMATKNARSATPEGFSYGFFMANNAIDNPVQAIHGKYDRLDRSLIEKAVAAGVTESEISSAVDDHYYMELDDDAANQAIRDLTSEAKEEGRAPVDVAPAADTAPPPDAGADIPTNFYSTVTVDYARLGADGKTVTEQLAADKALAQTREDISNLEALLKCMGHH